MKFFHGFFLYGGIVLAAFVAVIYMANTANITGSERTVELKGANLLPEPTYLSFAGLSKSVRTNVLPADIRDRLLRHPYVRDVIVDVREPGKMQIQIFEKKIVGRILTGSVELVLEHRGEVIKVLPQTSNLDVPVISGIKYDDKRMYARTDSLKLLTAYKYLKALAFGDIQFMKEISELACTDNGTLLITVNGIAPVFITDDKNIERQIAYLYGFSRNRNNYSQVVQSAKIIDVRFDRKIYVSGV